MANSGRRGWTKWLFILILIAAAVGAVFYFKKDHAEPPQYQTVTVARGDLTQVVTANGTLNPVLNVQVGSQISGNIAKLFADYNSLVKSNQIVAQLDPAIFEAAVQQAEADLASAKAGLELSKVEATRSESLFTNKLISGSDYDKAIATLHQGEAQVKMKQASLNRAKLDLSHCTIYAPVDGIVISRSVDVGQTVAASMNAPVLFQIANDLSNMQIDANVSEADVGTVEEGQLVNFTVDAYPNRTFLGRVTQIRNSPVTVQNVVTYDTVIGVTNSDFKLKPGMTATISIITAQRTNVLKVANAALRFRPPEPATNQTVVAQWLAKLGLGGEKKKPAATNEVAAAKPAGTNGIAVAAAAAPLTGNEAPEELFRRVREMRERGETVPPEIQSKLRALFQSGALQRPSGGPGGPGGGGRSRATQSASRNIYLLKMAKPADGGDPVPTAEPVRVRTGITDGVNTELMQGVKEGDEVIVSVKSSRPAATPSSSSGSSPFGGPRRF
jgi:HlyD family secretion protein